MLRSRTTCRAIGERSAELHAGARYLLRLLLLPVLLLWVLPAGSVHAQAVPIAPSLKPFEVRGVTPSQSALDISRGTTVQVTFTMPIDRTTITATSLQVLGRWSAMHTGTTTYRDGNRTIVFTPNQPFSAGEKVTVNIARTVQSVSGLSLDTGYAWTFWTDSRASTTLFTHIDTLTPGDTPYGAYGGDLDADGDLDLAIPNENTSDVSVFLNGGSANFSPATSYGVGLHCSPIEAADFNLDGKLDLAVANIFNHDVSLLFGNGDGSFQQQVRLPVGQQPRGITSLDVDGDGDADIITANRVSGDLSMLINNGAGVFAAEQRFQAGVSNETGVSASDMDNDGILDLVVIGYGDGVIAVMKGDGLGGFQLHSSRSFGPSPWMVATGDLNGDGFNDAVAAISGSSSSSSMRVILNDGAGGFLPPQSYAAGSFVISIDIGDLNGDGHLDVSTGAFSSGYFRQRFNNGDGTFGASFDLPSINTGSFTTLHDFDGDGDVDITALDEIADLVFLFRQDG